MDMFIIPYVESIMPSETKRMLIRRSTVLFQIPLKILTID